MANYAQVMVNELRHFGISIIHPLKAINHAFEIH